MPNVTTAFLVRAPASPRATPPLAARDDAEVVATPPLAAHTTGAIAAARSGVAGRGPRWGALFQNKTPRRVGCRFASRPEAPPADRRSRPRASQVAGKTTRVATSTTRSSCHNGAAGHPRRHVQALPRGEGRHDAACVRERDDGACGEARSPPVVRSLPDLANAKSAPVLTLSLSPRPQEMEYRVELFNKCVSCHRPSLIARLDVSSRSRLRRPTPSSLYPRVVVSGNLRLQKARTR